MTPSRELREAHARLVAANMAFRRIAEGEYQTAKAATTADPESAAHDAAFCDAARVVHNAGRLDIPSLADMARAPGTRSGVHAGYRDVGGDL